MDVITALIALSVGLGIGVGFTWLLAQSRLRHASDKSKAEADVDRAALQATLKSRDEQLLGLRTALEEATARTQTVQAEKDTLQTKAAGLEAQLQSEQKAFAEKQALLDEARQRLSETFKALSADALNQNNQSFLQQAKTTLAITQEAAKGDLSSRQQAIDELVKPLKEALGRLESKIQDLEKERATAYGSLTQNLQSMAVTQAQLKAETTNLVKALRAPQVRGRWGEIQLRRVVEMVGMVEYCDFTQQESITTDDGSRLRPDMVVKLPNHRQVVIDSKAPLMAYLEALEAHNDEIKTIKLKEHAKQVRTHLQKLSDKKYSSQFDSTPEFVVLFLPGEVFYSAALEQDPGLIEFGIGQNVVIATPTILIALLRAVASGWQQEQLTRHAQKISDLGQELYDRMGILASHFVRMGRGLDQAVESYNDAVGSFEGRLLATTRKFKDFAAATGKDIEAVSEIDKRPRALRATTAALISSTLKQHEIADQGANEQNTNSDNSDVIST